MSLARKARQQAHVGREMLDDEWKSSLADARKYAREHAAEIAAEWDAIEIPPRTIEGHLATMTPERRAELNAEWDAAPVDCTDAEQFPNIAQARRHAAKER